MSETVKTRGLIGGEGLLVARYALAAIQLQILEQIPADLYTVLSDTNEWDLMPLTNEVSNLRGAFKDIAATAVAAINGEIPPPITVDRHSVIKREPGDEWRLGQPEPDHDAVMDITFGKLDVRLISVLTRAGSNEYGRLGIELPAEGDNGWVHLLYRRQLNHQFTQSDGQQVRSGHELLQIDIPRMRSQELQYERPLTASANVNQTGTRPPEKRHQNIIFPGGLAKLDAKSQDSLNYSKAFSIANAVGVAALSAASLYVLMQSPV